MAGAQVIVQNQTPKPMTFITKHDYFTATPPPKIDARHNAPIMESYHYLGSALVYRLKNRFNDELDWVVSWSNPVTKSGDPAPQQQKVYTELRTPSPFTDKVWEDIYKRLMRATSTNTDETEECSANLEIKAGGDVTAPITITATLSYK